MTMEARWVADLPQGGGALLLDIGVWRDVFEGKDIVRGEAEDALRLDGAGEVAAARSVVSSASAALLSATSTTTGAWAAWAKSGM